MLIRTERNVDNYKERKKLDLGITVHFKGIKLFCKRRHGKKKNKLRKENVTGSTREGGKNTRSQEGRRTTGKSGGVLNKRPC